MLLSDSSKFNFTFQYFAGIIKKYKWIFYIEYCLSTLLYLHISSTSIL